MKLQHIYFHFQYEACFLNNGLIIQHVMLAFFILSVIENITIKPQRVMKFLAD